MSQAESCCCAASAARCMQKIKCRGLHAEDCMQLAGLRHHAVTVSYGHCRQTNRLARWRREYYPPREACCPGNPDPACDCTWGGNKFDALPPAAAYERIFSDECDGLTSMNRVSIL